jgi:hypothetical protein
MNGLAYNLLFTFERTMSDKWDDPIHGIIPEKYREWYIKNCGAFFRDGQWYVDPDDRTTVTHVCKKDGREFKGKYKRGDVIQLNILKAAALQEQILEVNQLIITHMGKKGFYILGRENTFDLIIHGETNLIYEKDGREYKETIRSRQQKTPAEHVFDPLYDN